MKRVALVAGGTGGHIYPAMALASAVKEQNPDCDIRFFGNGDRMEAQLVPDAGYPFYALKTSGLEGGFFDRVRAVAQLFSATAKARKYLKEFRPEIVAGFGGYVSAPVLLAAASLNIPTLLHEQNSIAGKANKLVVPVVKRFVTCYEEAGSSFPPEKTVLLGNPRGSIAARSKGDKKAFEKLGLDPDKATILVMMGSLGSSSVNQILKSALAEPIEGMQFLFVTGKDNEADLDLFAGRDDIVTVPFVDTLAIYPFLTGMVCRAGATTLAELTAIGVPAILIPSPYVANNHQYHNAMALMEKGAAHVIEEKDLEKDPGLLKEALVSFLGDGAARAAAAASARKLGKPDADRQMVAEMETLIHDA